MIVIHFQYSRHIVSKFSVQLSTKTYRQNISPKVSRRGDLSRKNLRNVAGHLVICQSLHQTIKKISKMKTTLHFSPATNDQYFSSLLRNVFDMQKRIPKNVWKMKLTFYVIKEWLILSCLPIFIFVLQEICFFLFEKMCQRILKSSILKIEFQYFL